MQANKQYTCMCTSYLYTHTHVTCMQRYYTLAAMHSKSCNNNVTSHMCMQRDVMYATCNNVNVRTYVLAVRTLLHGLSLATHAYTV